MLLQNCFIMQNLKIMLLPYNGYFSNTFIYKNKHKSCILNKIFMKMERLNLTRISQFLALRFYAPKRISQKTGFITHASIKPSLAQEMPVLY